MASSGDIWLWLYNTFGGGGRSREHSGESGIWTLYPIPLIPGLVIYVHAIARSIGCYGYSTKEVKKLKIKNLLGNVYEGSIGKSVTASTWKGRNYLKKWFKPTNPNSVLQQTVRSLMQVGNTTWHGFIQGQKRAYFWFERYRKKNISPFNAMIGSYIGIEKASPGTYLPPPATVMGFRDSVTLNPLQGVKAVVKKTGQATVYALEYSDVTGTTNCGLASEDQNFDLLATLSGYNDYSISDQTAGNTATMHDMVVTP